MDFLLWSIGNGIIGAIIILCICGDELREKTDDDE